MGRDNTVYCISSANIGVWYLTRVTMGEVDLAALFLSSFLALGFLGLECLSWGFLFRTFRFVFVLLW